MSENKISLRAAVETDTIMINQLVREGRINPVGLDWKRFLVATTQNDEVIACVQIKPHLDGSEELASLVVTRNWRNKGIAKKLIQKVITSHQGDLYLICRSKLAPMYEKFHFNHVPEEKMPKYFRRVSKLFKLVLPLRKGGGSLSIMVHLGNQKG